MPKSKREKLLHLTQVAKKTREHKDKLFNNIRDTLPDYQYCYVVRVDNMRNQHLQEVRKTIHDGRLFLGKTKLMARALGTTEGEALLPGIDQLAGPYLRGGAVGLLVANRTPDDVRDALAALQPVDFARAGTVAPRDIIVPHGALFSTGGLVPAADDVPLAPALEPELRRLGMPTRLVKGKVTLEAPDADADSSPDDNNSSPAGYVICRAGQTLDSRQTRLLRLFGVCLSEFRIAVQAYWTAATGEVTRLEPPPALKSSHGGAASAAAAVTDGEDEDIPDADAAEDE